MKNLHISFQDKLHNIFRERLVLIQESKRSWSEYLEDLEVERQGKLMSMIIPCPDDKIEFLDPLGNEAKIRVSKEQAIKIATLGYIPEETT